MEKAACTASFTLDGERRAAAVPARGGYAGSLERKRALLAPEFGIPELFAPA